MELQDFSETTHPISGIKRVNQERILWALQRWGKLTRLQLAKQTGLKGVAVSRITRELIDKGLLLEIERVEVSGKAGRKELALSINPKGAFVLAITLTANCISVSLANALGETITSKKLQLEYDIIAADVLTAVCTAARQQIAIAGIDRKRLVGVGVLISARSRNCINGVVTSETLGWKNVPVQKIIEAELGLHVNIIPRAIALLKFELLQELPKTPETVVLINVSLGMGACAMVEGHILSGASCDFSHLSVSGEDKLCRCGHKGCLETTASGFAVIDQLALTTDKDGPMDGRRNSALLEQALLKAYSGNLEAKQAFFEAGQKMAYGLDVVAAFFDPHQIVLTGETGRQSDFVAGVKNILKNIHSTEPKFELKISSVTSNTAAILHGLDCFLYTQNPPLTRNRYYVHSDWFVECRY